MVSSPMDWMSWLQMLGVVLGVVVALGTVVSAIAGMGFAASRWGSAIRHECQGIREAVNHLAESLREKMEGLRDRIDEHGEGVERLNEGFSDLEVRVVRLEEKVSKVVGPVSIAAITSDPS
jgi:methyl-accepting chemotaxis protein